MPEHFTYIDDFDKRVILCTIVIFLQHVSTCFLVILREWTSVESINQEYNEIVNTRNIKHINNKVREFDVL
jgi:hypothetical protein